MIDDNGLNKRFILTLLNGPGVVVALAAVVFLMVRTPSIQNQILLGLAATIAGGLMQQHALSQGWWFGSTKGSTDKTDTLRDIATNKSTEVHK